MAVVIFVAALLFLSSAVTSHANEDFNDKDIYSKIVARAPQVGVKPTPAPARAPARAPAVVKPPGPAPPVVMKPPTPSPPAYPPLPPVKSIKDCEPLCGERCKKHSRKNVCERACMTCCDRCRCVPPGTYGNKERCGKCYTNMTTRGNKPKCP